MTHSESDKAKFKLIDEKMAKLLHEQIKKRRQRMTSLLESLDSSVAKQGRLTQTRSDNNDKEAPKS